MARADFLGDSYDPSKIVTKSSDDHGHSTNLRVHVPVHWYGIAQQLKESSLWPEYRTVADVMRDAFYHRMPFWAEGRDPSVHPHIKEAIFQEQMRQRIENSRNRAAYWKDFADTLDESLTELIAEGNKHEAKSILEDLLHRLDEVDEPYKSDLRILIDAWTARAKLSWT